MHRQAPTKGSMGLTAPEVWRSMLTTGYVPRQAENTKIDVTDAVLF